MTDENCTIIELLQNYNIIKHQHTSGVKIYIIIGISRPKLAQRKYANLIRIYYIAIVQNIRAWKKPIYRGIPLKF